MSKSLQDLIDAAGGDPLAHLRSRKYDLLGPRQYSPGQLVPQVPFEFSNWELETRAWHERVALLDQTHHMEGLHIQGPDAQAFLSALACNDLSNAQPGRAHQMVVTTPRGHLIGEDILFHHGPNHFYLCGVPFAINWVRYQAERGHWNVDLKFDGPRSPVYANGHGSQREYCRYQIQGPNAWALIEKLNDGPVEQVGFFRLTELNIGRRRVQALRHGMGGAPGLEIWAPFEWRDELRETIVEAGQEFGISLVGAGAYPLTGIESGYLQWCVPGIYSGDELADYRRWLSADEMEGQNRLGGSHALANVQDYYMTPYEFGYGFLVKLNHDFIGFDALKAVDIEATARKKVTIQWNPDDTAGLLREMLTPGAERIRNLHLPVPSDKTDITYDTITIDDVPVGTGHTTGYSSPEQSMLTLSLVDPRVEIGQEVVLHWGEAGGGYGDRTVEPRPTREIRGIVSPAPFTQIAREQYTPGWRTKAAVSS